MQEAALLAGLAIDGGGTGVAHSIGHALGTLAHVPHGVAVAIGLAAALDWNVEGAPDTYVSAAVALGRPINALPDLFSESDGGRDQPRDEPAAELEVEVDELAAGMIAEENLRCTTTTAASPTTPNDVGSRCARLRYGAT